jgi:L-galactose dehydrogenase
MQYRTLGRTGLSVSELGFGAATLGNEYGHSDPQDGARAVACAIDLGINFFDVAPYYGRTLAETRLGEALKGCRNKVIVATKCARFDVDVFDFSAASLLRSAEESLRRLQTDYLDILHIHDVEYGDKQQIVNETIPALQRLQQQGKTRFIGVTGLALKMLREIAEEAEVDCILSYCRYTLLNRDLNETLAPFTAARGIGLTSASPLHMRLLSDAGPPPWHPAPQLVKEAAAEVVRLCRAQGYNPADVALQFAAGNPYVACTLVGISNSEEVRANVRAIRGTVNAELLREIDRITAPVWKMTWLTGRPENH